MSTRYGETPEGLWLMGAAALPAGGYAWHRFRGRGYVALVGVAEVARISPVADGGFFLRVHGFQWSATPSAGPAVGRDLPPDGRWFPSLRAAIAAAGKLLSGPPFHRQELVAAPAVKSSAPEQAALEF